MHFSTLRTSWVHCCFLAGQSWQHWSSRRACWSMPEDRYHTQLECNCWATFQSTTNHSFVPKSILYLLVRLPHKKAVRTVSRNSTPMPRVAGNCRVAPSWIVRFFRNAGRTYGPSGLHINGCAKGCSTLRCRSCQTIATDNVCPTHAILHTVKCAEGQVL